MNRLILFFVFLYLPYSAFSQGIWKTYTRADGLAGDSISCITQDKFGNYWIGAYRSGLSKLDTDGIIINFTDSIGSITSIYDIEIDSANNKWLAVADYRDGGTYVVKFNDSTFTYYTPTYSPYYDPRPFCLGQDSSGHIWCGTSDELAFWFDGVNWHGIRVPGTWGSLCSIYDIETDRLGKLYFAHYKGIATKDWYLFGDGYLWTFDIEFDRDNIMWCATSDGKTGLVRFDGQNWTSYGTGNGLLSNDLAAVAIDSNNNVWISYLWNKVTKFNHNNFNHFTLPSPPQGGIYDQLFNIYVDQQGKIWFTTWQGLLVLEDTTTTNVNPIINPNNNNSHIYLLRNYPNPFNSFTTVNYNLNKSGKVELFIFNIMGKEVIQLVNKHQPEGKYQVFWDSKDKFGREVSSGIYIAVLNTGNYKKAIKLNLIR